MKVIKITIVILLFTFFVPLLDLTKQSNVDKSTTLVEISENTYDLYSQNDIDSMELLENISDVDSVELLESINRDNFLGYWRKAPSDREGFSKSYYFYDDNLFINYENGVYFLGKWTLNDNILILEIDNIETEAGFIVVEQEIISETTELGEVAGILLDGELYLYIQNQHLYYETISLQHGDIQDFEGHWQRTNVVASEAADIHIVDQTDLGFTFDIGAMFGGNMGAMNGFANIVAPNQAFYYLESIHDENHYGLILFTIIDGKMIVDYDGSIYALPFGMNVTADGVYVRGEAVYTNANIVDEILPTIEIRDRLRSLVGDVAYEQIIFIMEWGFQYPSEEYTFEGFVSGIGVGVQLLIQDDGKIYCLGYFLDSPWYTFYTNDPEYKDRLPDWVNIWRDSYELSFVYKDV